MNHPQHTGKGGGPSSYAAAASAGDFSVVISASGRADIPSENSSSSSAPTTSAHLVHAVSVAQPVQSWTVIRDHVDFVALGAALSSVIPGLPACPPPPSRFSGGVGGASSSSGDEMDDMVDTRHALQQWLTSVLLYPGARESPHLRQFLCYGANLVPPQFEGVAWISFQAAHAPTSGGGAAAHPAAPQAQHQASPSAGSAAEAGAEHHHLAAQHGGHGHAAAGGGGSASSDGAGGHGQQPHHQHHQQQQGATHQNNLDEEMEMDDMFGYEEEHDDDESDVDGGHGQHGDGGGHEENLDDADDEDDAEYYSATVRYQPTEEVVTQDDIMEMQQQAGEVEMIEDVGSLAMSLGASHLGRSLQLQAQLATGQMKHHGGGPAHLHQQQGLTVGGAKPPSAASGNGAPLQGGGIGGAVEKASRGAAPAPPPPPQSKIDGLGDSFHSKKPVSAPSLDSFKMIKVIGKGSFGKVFLVREKSTNEMFALKVLTKDNIIKRNQVEHTRTERSVLGYVNHPFIVGLNMAFQSKDKLYFVLDYCAGGELFFHLSKVGKFPEARARYYAAEIVLAMAYVHDLDIVYRDLKPENVLLDARGHVRLTDFGLSKEGISSSSSGATSFCGTPEYLAPEILNRQGHGRGVDWWSLGALLYEMLTGLPPFYCRDREKLFEKIRRGHLDYPRSLTAPAQALLRGLLTKDPKRRLGSGPGDAEEIKNHPFYESIIWTKLANGEIPPPWEPPVLSSLDTSQFDEEFTSMPMFSPGSLQPQSGLGTTPDNLFEGFTFTDRQFYGPAGTTS